MASIVAFDTPADEASEFTNEYCVLSFCELWLEGVYVSCASCADAVEEADFPDEMPCC
jgi:hypothetical protein